MTNFPSDVAFTPAVKAAQERRGTREAYRRMEEGRGWRTTVTPDLARFVAGLDHFYLGTATGEGQPYIQHRGGPTGFLKVIDERTLAFADFVGNGQFLTVGNLSENPKAFLFLIDYAERRRMKLWGTAHIVEGDAALLEKLGDPEYLGHPERAILFRIEAWDINCPQHIKRRYPEETVQALRARVAELEAELRRRSGA